MPALSAASQKLRFQRTDCVYLTPRKLYTGATGSTEQIPEDQYVSQSVDLSTYVLRQVAAELAVEDRLITAYILNHLDEDGFLTTTVMEIARYHHRLPSEVTEIIEMLKRCDPPVGVCSSTPPQEAMLAQIDALAETAKIPEHTRDVVQNFLHKLSQQNYAEIAKKTGHDQSAHPKDI